jgi:alkane 1-monooxygenase
MAWLSFRGHGVMAFLPVIWAYVIIPLLELFIKPNPSNLTEAEEEMMRQDYRFDGLLYAVVILQYISLIFFLVSLQEPQLSWITLVGRVMTMGLLCGIFGINVGHELGHRKQKKEQWLAKASLLSSQYLHFFIEHNKGHHKHVATPHDPASARWGESLFAFYPRSIIGSYINAWRIANKEMKRDQRSWWQHEMLLYTILQIFFVLLILLIFGFTITLFYLIAALLGIGLLETVNYIEHYGLSRQMIGEQRYERTKPAHSWNSDHVIGRMVLFELSRHSDHHYMASRKYQLLRNFQEAPQLPTGYPGMMILAHIPPLFFSIMHRRIRAFNAVQSVSA